MNRFERRYYIRKVTTTIVDIEYWASTAGKPMYIEQDGHRITQVELSRTAVVSEEFREATEVERAALDALAQRE